MGRTARLSAPRDGARCTLEGCLSSPTDRLLFNLEKPFDLGQHLGAGPAGLPRPPVVEGSAGDPDLPGAFPKPTRPSYPIKYKDIYLQSYQEVPELHQGLGRYFGFSNDERLPQSLGYRTPAAVHRGVSATRA